MGRSCAIRRPTHYRLRAPALLTVHLSEALGQVMNEPRHSLDVRVLERVGSPLDRIIHIFRLQVIRIGVAGASK